MAILRIEGFPDDLMRDLKIKAATEGTTVKAVMIAAAENALGRKASGIDRVLEQTRPRKAGGK